MLRLPAETVNLATVGQVLELQGLAEEHLAFETNAKDLCSAIRAVRWKSGLAEERVNSPFRRASVGLGVTRSGASALRHVAEGRWVGSQPCIPFIFYTSIPIPVRECPFTRVRVFLSLSDVAAVANQRPGGARGIRPGLQVLYNVRMAPRLCHRATTGR